MAALAALSGITPGGMAYADAPSTPTITASCSSSYNWSAFNTGINAALNGVLTTNASNLDLNWQAAGPFSPVGRQWTADEVNQMVGNPQGVDVALTSPATTGWAPAYVARYATWQAPPTTFSPNATWISQTSSTNQPNGSFDFAYLIQFTVPSGVNPAAITFDMAFMADNAVVAIYVNGAFQPGTYPFSPGVGYSPSSQGFESTAATQTTLSGFQTGTNSIVVQVESGPAYEGFLASVSGSAACTVLPPPVVAVPLGSGAPTMLWIVLGTLLVGWGGKRIRQY